MIVPVKRVKSQAGKGQALEYRAKRAVIWWNDGNISVLVQVREVLLWWPVPVN